MTDAAERRRAVEAAVERFSRVDVLVNNAGQGSLGAFEEFSSERIRQHFEVRGEATAFDGAGEAIHRLFVPPLVGEKNAQVVVGLGEIRSELDRPLERFDGPVVRVRLVVGHAEVVVEDGVGRVVPYPAATASPRSRALPGPR